MEGPPGISRCLEARKVEAPISIADEKTGEIQPPGRQEILVDAVARGNNNEELSD